MSKELEEAIKEFNKLIQLRISKTDRKIKYDSCIVSTEKLQIILQALENSIPKQYIRDILKELNEEYIKVEKIFNKHFEKENRDMQDYYIQKEATETMQTIGWLEGKLKELLKENKENPSSIRARKVDRFN